MSARSYRFEVRRVVGDGAKMSCPVVHSTPSYKRAKELALDLVRVQKISWRRVGVFDTKLGRWIPRVPEALL